MEEKIRKRNTKSEKQIIIKNELKQDEYDFKVYNSELNKEHKKDEVEEIDEGMQMVF